MRLNHFYLLILFFISTLNTYSQEQGFPIIRNYSPKEYNSTPQVVSVMQGNSGMMYFGLASTIIEYDGVTWRQIKTKRNETAYDLQMCNKNTCIYVTGGNEFGFLTSDEKGNTIYKSLTHLITDTTYYIGTFWNIISTSEFVYFQTENAIIQFNPETEKAHIFKKETNGQYSPGFVYNNTFYIHLNKEGLVKIESNELKPALHSEFFKDLSPIVSGINLDQKKILLPTQNSGLFVYEVDNEIIPENIPLKGSNFLTDNSISRFIKFDDSTYVIGSMKKGAVLITSSGTVKQEYNETSLLQNNYTRSLTLDTDNNIWMSLSRGISKTEHGTDLSYWNESTGLRDIVEDVVRYNDTLYIATHQNVYYLDKKNQLQVVKNIQTGLNWNFLITQNPKSLLLGSQTGIYEINGNRASLIVKGAHASILYQSKSDSRRIYSTLNESLVSLKYQNNKWQLEGVWEGINDNIRGIIESNNGEVWLGTFRNGVIRVTPNPNNITKPLRSKLYNLNDGFKSLKNILPFRFDDKVIWGTETGLFIYNSNLDIFEPFCELGKQFCDGSRDVFDLQQMPDGTIWISPLENSKADIGFLKPKKDGGYEWIYAPFRRIPHMLLVTFYVENSGVTWIGGSEGLYKYDISKDIKDYTKSFNSYIRKVVIGNDSIIHAGCKIAPNKSKYKTTNPEINYKHNTLKFEFAAPFFDQEDKTLYSFKLVGYDSDWSHWSRQTEKEYTNLQEGDYTFMVKARNVYDIESTTDSFSLTIAPPPYRTIWAYIIYSIAVIVLGWLIVRLNTQRLKAENVKLEEIVKERTSDLSEVNTQLEEQQAELEIKQEEITLQANLLADTNTELEKLSIVASETANAVIIMDENFNFEWINEGFTKFYGLTLSDLKTTHGENLVNGSNYSNIKQATENCKETKKSVQYDNQVTRGNLTRWVQTTLTPIFDHNGDIRKYVAIDSDITDIKLAEQSLKEQKDEIQSQNIKLREMDDFKQGMTSMIVHDLKNPLNMILNMPESYDTIKKEKIIHQSARQMLNMVLNILDVHKYEEVGLKLELKDRRLEPIGLKAAEKVHFLCEQKAITLHIDIDPNLTVWAEADTLERVFINLLTNAIKHSPIGETISINTHIIEPEIVRIDVTNKGDGIDEDKKHLVFQKFGQIIAKKSGEIKSTGLGLAFCKMAVEALSGEIEVNTDIEGQTTFWFTLKMGNKSQVTETKIVKNPKTESNIIKFTEEEVQILNPIIKKLKSFTIYETDDVEEILNDLHSIDSENINNWRYQMEQSLSTLNQIKYLELLNINFV
jgi:PAS domain S-box-containing protein